MVESINAVTPLDEARKTLAAAYDLSYTKAVAAVTAGLYERIKASTSEADWPRLAPLIVHINRLKQEKRALILAHQTQSPAIYFGVADVTGDTMTLATRAARSRQRILVQCGTLFMAEVTKLLSPKKTVVIPDSRSSCTVAASITPDDVLAIKAQYPGVPVVATINSSAAVKAESDICCTAGNAVAVLSSLPDERAIMLPDQYLARNLAKRAGKKLITWAGTCEALDGITAAAVAEHRAAHPAAKVVADISAPPDVTAAADFTGSLTEVIAWIRTEKPSEVVMITERSAAENAAAENPQTRIVFGGNPPHHAQRITLENILWSLHTMTEPVEVRDDVAIPARKALQRMRQVERRKR